MAAAMGIYGHVGDEIFNELFRLLIISLLMGPPLRCLNDNVFNSAFSTRPNPLTTENNLTAIIPSRPHVLKCAVKLNSL